MADVGHTIGGFLLRPPLPPGQLCDFCPPLLRVPATQRLQGETDSMGAEWLDLCDHHTTTSRACPTCGWLTCEIEAMHAGDARERTGLPRGPETHPALEGAAHG